MDANELRAYTVSELQTLLGTPAAKRMKKEQLVQAILHRQAQRARIAHWEHEVLVRGYQSVIQLVNGLREELGLPTISDIPRALDPVAAAISGGTSYQTWTAPSIVRVYEGDVLVAERLHDEWGYEFVRRLEAGRYEEWRVV